MRLHEGDANSPKRKLELRESVIECQQHPTLGGVRVKLTPVVNWVGTRSSRFLDWRAMKLDPIARAARLRISGRARYTMLRATYTGRPRTKRGHQCPCNL